MKRLNLNNIIATTAMLTKTNAMKNKMNFFAKVFMLVVMMGMLMPNVAWGQAWTQPDGAGTPWYIIKDATTGTKDDNAKTSNSPIYLPKCSLTTSETDVTYKMSGTVVTYSVRYFVSFDTYDVWTKDSKKENKTDHFSYNSTSGTNVTMYYGWRKLSGNNSKDKSVTVSIKVPVHYDKKFTNTTNFESPNAQYSGVPDGVTNIQFKLSDLFTSFLTNSNGGSLTFEIGDATGYINPSDYDAAQNKKTFYMDDYNICGANEKLQPGDGTAYDKPVVIHFKPRALGDFSAIVTVKFNGGSIGTFTVSGSCVASKQTIDWHLNPGDEVMTIGTSMALNAEANTKNPITYTSDNPNAISVVSTQTDDGHTIYALQANAMGSANITAHAAASAGWLPTDSIKQFRVSNMQPQYVEWTDATIQALRSTKLASPTTPSSPIPLNAIVKDRNGNTLTGPNHTVTYSILSAKDVSGTEGGTAVAEKTNGNQITLKKKGTVVIQASVAESGNETDGGYFEASTTYTFSIRVDGESCSQYAYEAPGNINSNTSNIPLSGIPERMTGTLRCRNADRTTQIKDQKTVNLWEKDYSYVVSETTYDINTSIPENTTKLNISFSGAVLGIKLIENLKVTQKTYFTPDPNGYYRQSDNTYKKDFTTTQVGVPTPSITFDINYANVPDIDYTITGDADQFEIAENTVTVDCDCHGTKTYTILFKPTSEGKKIATVVFKSKLINQEVKCTLTLEGVGTKLPNTLTWGDDFPNQRLLSLNALSTQVGGAIDLTGSAIATCVDVNHPVYYTLTNCLPDNSIASIADDGHTLSIHKSGSFKLTAHQDGNDAYNKAEGNTYSQTFTISKLIPNLEITGNQAPAVFSAFQVSASSEGSSDGYSRASDGEITFSIDPAANTSATITNCSEANKSCNVTVNSRVTEEGSPVKIVAHLAATDIYEAKTETLTVNATKVTPNLQCSVASLTKTALTNLSFTEMPVTITNSTDIWHDIAVTYSSSDQTIAVLDGDHFRLLKSGKCTITAKVEAGVNNNVSSNTIPIKLNVALADQTITWNLSSDEQATHYSGDSFTLTATCPANNVTYTSSNDNIATVDANGVLTFHNAGSVIITAHSIATEVYNAAADKDQTFSAALSNFPDTYIGQASTSQSIDLSNLSGATSLTLTSSNPTVFRAFTNNEASANTSLNNSLNISEATTVNVKFYPESVGEVSGTITISGNNGKSIAIPVKGKGLQQSVTFGSTNARIPRGTIESRTISLDNMVSNAGYTVTSNGQPFIVSQPQNGKFTIAFLPQDNTGFSGFSVTIHDNAFGTTTTHDYKINVAGYADAVETVDFGNVNARSTSSTTRQITLSGVDKIPGLMIASDENTSYLIDNNSSAFAAADGQHTVSFTPVHYSTYNGKQVYLYIADNTTDKYPLLKCNGVGNQVNLSSEIVWVNTTISTQEKTTGMAKINNTAYGSYVRLYYTNNGDFYDYNSHPTDLEIDKTEIFAPSAGVSTVTAHVEALDGSDDFIGESSAEITATDKPIQKISYSSNIYYVVLNDDVEVDVYAYDSKNPSTRIDADFTMTCADSKVTITKGTYDNTNYVQQFTIHGAAAGSTTVSITSTPKGTSSGYESATETGIPVTILANGNSCATQSVLKNPSDNKFNTSGAGGPKTFNLTGAPCRSFNATLNYKFGTPTLNISDGTNTLVNTTYGSSVLAWETKTENITYKYNAGSKHKPTILTVSLTGATIVGNAEGSKDLTITEFSQLSYFDVISNHPNGSDIDFRSVSVGSASVNETIKVDYSALHKAVELSLTDETNFTIVNKAEVLGKITNCGLWGELDIIVKYNPTVAGTHTATLTIKGYTTDDNNNESIKTYTYTLKGQSSKRTQIITWDNDNKYSIMYLVPERTLELKASSNQPVYGSTNPMPITYTFGNDGDGVATLTDGVLTIAKAGTITVIAHQAGDEYTEAATDVPLTITFTLEPQHIVWRNEDWSGNKDSDTKTIFTDALTSTGYELKILVQDSHGADLSHDPEFRIENEINCSGETDLIRIEKNANDNKFYAYYNNRGTGKVKITATHSGNASYSQMEAADEKSMYLVIEKRTPSITYNEDQLNEVYVGDRIDALTRPTTTIDFPAAIFNYDASTNINFSQNADAYVTLTKNDDNTTSLDAIHTTDGSIIYIHAKQQYNECYNDEATSGNIVFTVKKTPIAIEWNQTLDLSTGQYDENGAVYQLDGKVRDTRHDKIIDNLAIAYSLTISDKGCNYIPNDQIAKIEGNQLHVYGATSATLTITASQNGTTTDGYADYNAAENVQREFTIQKITPTITFEPQTSMVYGDKVALTASSAYNDIYSSDNDEDKVFRFTSSSTEITVNGNYMEARGVTTGSGVTLTASQDNNCMIENVADVGGNVTVNLAPQKMVWGGDTSINIDVAGTQSFTFNPYAIDKNHINQEETWLTLTDGQFKTESEVEYEIRNVSICGDNPGETEMVSIDGNGVIKATGKGTGVVRIYAKAVGDFRYAEITDDEDKVYIEVTVETVKPKIQSFDISSLDDIHYGDRVKLSSPTTSYFVNQGDNKTTFSYANNAAYGISAFGTDTMFDAKAAGTGYTITATQEAIACFNQASDAFTRGTFNIAKSEQEIEWNNQTTLSIDGVSNDYQTDGISLTAKAMDKRHKAGGSQTWLSNLETGLPVTYTFTDVTVEKCGSDVDIISIDGNGKLTATGLGSGTVTITATQVEGNETYNGITADEDKKSITVTVNKITPDLKIYDAEGSSLNGETLSVYYGDPEYTQLACQVTFAGTNNELKDATGNTLYSIDDIILTDDGQGVVTINGNGISFNKAGVATITATLKSDCRVSQDLTATFYVNVQKPAQEIKFEQDIENQTTLNYHNVVLTAYSYDNVHNRKIEDLAVSYAISTSDGCGEIATYSGNTVHVTGLGAGTVTITASQAGDDRYGAAQDVVRGFIIAKETPTVDFTIAKVNEEDYSESTVIHYNDVLTLAGTSIVEGTSYDGHEHVTFKYNDETISGNQVTVTDQQFTLQAVQAVDCIVNSGQSEVKDYQASLTPTEIMWNQTIPDQTTTSPMQPMTLTAEVWDTQHNVKINDATVTFSISGNTTTGCGDIATLSDENLLTVTGNGAGTVKLTASYSGESGKYDEATSVEKSFTITKAVPQFNWAVAGDLNATYGDNNVTATTTHDGTGTVTYGSSDETVATIDGDGAITLLKQGETEIYAALAATCKYEAAQITKKLTVGRKPRTLNWSTAPSDMTYGSTQTVAATPSEGGGTITYSIDDNTHATINPSTGEITANGVTSTPITVTATIEATDQYENASKTGTFNITPATATFVWGGEWSSAVAKEMDYQASETLSVVCLTEGYNDYSVTYTAADGDVQYVNIQDDVVTVADVKSTGNVTVKATIHDNNGNYSDVVLTTEIHTNKIDVPNGIFSFNDVTLTYNGGGENLDGYISCSIIGMQYSISDYTISQSGGVTYVSLGGNDNKTLSPVNATNGANVTVTARITGMTNYNDCDVTGNVVVNKGTQMITWDEDKDYTVSNMAGSINLSDYCTLNVGGGNISFISSDNNIAEVSGNNLDIKQITTESTVTITATAEETDNYKKANESREFTITVAPPTIIIAEGSSDAPIDLETTTPQVTSVTESEDFATVLKSKGAISCNYDEVTYSFSSLDDNIATFTDGVNIKAFKRSDKLGIQVTASVTGLASVTETLYVKIPRGTMIFNRDGNWHGILNDGSNWQRRDMLPSADDHNVSIQANCTIDNTAIAECFDLGIVNGGMLTVNADGVLDVKGTITNTVASQLKLKANASHSATVLFAGGSPDATVENYIQGGLHSEGEGKPNNPDWQYRGFVGDNPSLSDIWNVVIFKWNETLNNTNCWGTDPVYTNETVNYPFSPWDGYCMANYDGGHERDYTSKLISTGTGYTYNLSYTNHGQEYPNRGVNLITNSWSAPIDMSSSGVVFDGSVENTFYFYQTRNHNAWEADSTSTFVVYPKNTGHLTASSTMIASGQSFLVKATKAGATLTINGSALAHEPNGKMYAPAEKERFNVLSITMSNDTMADRVFLLESENCSRAFDNGYDGTKIKEGNMPQIFASNDFGHTAVNTDKTMLGQRIGYSAAKDGALCTITFNTERLEGFSELYLYDLVTRRYANILAGDSYSFTGTKAGEEERFEIVGRRDDGSEFVTSSDMMIEVIGNRALLSGFAGGNDEVFITDMNGKRLWTERASNGPWFELPYLPAGVYLINCGEANCKFIVK